ncbi:MAG: aldehyde ferredoxin oxidoreductase C-terminal domain-containing protein [Chloroflexota bacterium]
MAELYGYAGKILRVDLTSEKITEEKLDEKTLRKYVGGTSLAAKYLYDEVPAKADWSSPENRLMFFSGPLTGTRVGGSGTISIVTKGANTNMSASSQANGYFATFMKFSGFDGVIVQGIAKRWLYLYLHEGKAELREASSLIGVNTWVIGDKIAEELKLTPAQLSVIGIGPAGENLVKFAAIAGDKGHVAAHSGIGAVMGSKKLKAVAAARSGKVVNVKDAESLADAAQAIFEHAKAVGGGGGYLWGTIGGVGARSPQLPIKNYTTNIYPISEADWDKYKAPYIRQTFGVGRKPCWACQRHHCYMFKIPDGPYAGYETEEPEYESMASFGPATGVTDVSSTIMLAGENDALGMDCNESGWVIGLVMECYEKGLLTKDDCDGLEMKWGNVAATKEMLYKIANRDGFGDILAEGAMRAAKRIGGDAPKFAIHTMKGTAPRGHDHRITWNELFDTCFSNTGTIEATGGMPQPDQLGFKPVTDPHNWEHVITENANLNGRRLFEDSLVVCRQACQELGLDIEALNAATGWNFTKDEAMAVGRRAVNQLRMYNFRCGLKPEMEAPSPRYGSAVPDGPSKGLSTAQDWDKIRTRYYELMGWDKKTGKPLPETLKKLGLEHTVRDL